MHDGADPHLIELIDVDPLAFDEAADADADSALPAGRRSPWRIALAMAGVAGVLGATLLVWQPWRHDPQQQWTNRLVLDRPVHEVVDVAIDAPWQGASAEEVGFVFAEPGAVLPFLLGGSGRSATWTSYAADSLRGAYGSIGQGDLPTVEVQGVPAEVAGVSGSVVRIRFGPLAGRMYEVTTNAMTKDEALHFAGAVGVDNGEPVLRDPSVLHGMQPVGSDDQFNAALGLLGSGWYGPSFQPYTSVSYTTGGAATHIASIADDTDGVLMTMTELVLGATPGRTVHGQTALTRDVRRLTNDTQEIATIVAWHERGRFITVSGRGDMEETLAAAEGAREATEDEWEPIAAQATEFSTRFPATIGYRRTVGGAFNGTVTALTATYEAASGLRICLDDGYNTYADCATKSDARLPLLTIMHIHTVAFVVAMVEADAALPELRIERTGGVIDTHILFRPSLSIPGRAVAVFVPEDLVGATLLVDGEIVATL
ncbi:MAG: hypothetical protein WCC60_07820 [Ilumatobacteraceae bacterium]